MDAKKVFEQIMLERHTNYNEMAAKLGINAQSLRNKINQIHFRYFVCVMRTVYILKWVIICLCVTDIF